VTILAAFGVILGCWAVFELRLRPVVALAARVEAENTVSALLEQAVTEELSAVQTGYADYITIQRDTDGSITALTADMAALNLLRADLISSIVQRLDGFQQPTVCIPVGSLFSTTLFWAQGPAIRLKTLRTGTVSAEFESQFTDAGVNQTRHSIWLDVSVPMTVLLPGGAVEVPVETRLCVAETVIVGSVPNTYFQLGGALSSG
jgi:sporulation protein YunB